MENQKTLITLISITLSASLFLAIFLVTHPVQDPENRGNQRADILEKFDGNTRLADAPLEGAAAKLLALTENGVVSPKPGSRNNSVVYYEKGTGRVYETDITNGKQAAISERVLANFAGAVWSPRRNEVIGRFTSTKGFDYRYYGLDTGQSADLGTKIKSLVFSPSGSQIAYFQTSEEGSGVYIAQPDGSVSKKILETRLTEMELFWPTEEKLAFAARDGETQFWNLYALSREGELEKLLEFQPGLSVKFSPDGSKVLFSFIADGGSLSLVIKDLATRSQTDLSLETFASKCAWSIDAKAIICGVPTSHLATDSELGSSISDELFQIDLTNGTKKQLWAKSSNRTNINVRDIFLSSLGDYAILLNAFDDKLYSLPL